MKYILLLSRTHFGQQLQEVKMRTDSNAGQGQKQGISARILRENHEWLKKAAAAQDRSANWLLDKLLTEAREADEQGAEDAQKH